MVAAVNAVHDQGRQLLLLNAAFYAPALLARDAVDVDVLSGTADSNWVWAPAMCARSSRPPVSRTERR